MRKPTDGTHVVLQTSGRRPLRHDSVAGKRAAWQVRKHPKWGWRRNMALVEVTVGEVPNEEAIEYRQFNLFEVRSKYPKE